MHRPSWSRGIAVRWVFLVAGDCLLGVGSFAGFLAHDQLREIEHGAASVEEILFIGRLLEPFVRSEYAQVKQQMSAVRAAGIGLAVIGSVMFMVSLIMIMIMLGNPPKRPSVGNDGPGPADQRGSV